MKYTGPERRRYDERDRHLRVAFVIWLVVFTTVTILVVRENRHRATEGRQAHAALCVFKQDLQRRVVQGVEFLREHPDGIPGIPAKVFQQSIGNQVSAIRALDRLECDPATPPTVTVKTDTKDGSK